MTCGAAKTHTADAGRNAARSSADRRRRYLRGAGSLMAAGCLLGLLFLFLPHVSDEHRMLLQVTVYLVSLGAVATGLALLAVIVLGGGWRRMALLCVLFAHAPLGMLLICRGWPWPWPLLIAGGAIVLSCAFGLLGGNVAASGDRGRFWAVGRETLVLFSLAGSAVPWLAAAVLHELHVGRQDPVHLIVLVAATGAAMLLLSRLILCVARLGGAGAIASGLIVSAAGASAVGLVCGLFVAPADPPLGLEAFATDVAVAWLALWLVFEIREKLPQVKPAP